MSDLFCATYEHPVSLQYEFQYSDEDEAVPADDVAVKIENLYYNSKGS